MSALSPNFTEKEFAIGAYCCYIYGRSDINESFKENLINKTFRDYGYLYTLWTEFSNSDGTILVFRNGDDWLISLKGTHIGSSTELKDIQSDISLAFTLQNFDRQFNNRRNKVVQLITRIKLLTSNEARIYLSGHSLSSTICEYCMITNEYILNNITKAYLFNPGTSPLFVNRILGLIRQKDIFKEKIEIHHVRGDLISTSSNFLYGTLINHTLNTSYSKKLLSAFVKISGVVINLFYSLLQTPSYHSITNFFI